MRTEAIERADSMETPEPEGPQHAYGLRHVGQGLYVVVRVTEDGEEQLTRPERRGFALGALVEACEVDSWD